MKNWDLVKNTKVTLRVKIGGKKLLFADVRKLDIGAVIELNQSANDPLEILIGDTLVGFGDAVIVDGNFGIKIKEMIKKNK